MVPQPPPKQWVPGALSQGGTGWEVKLIIHFHLASRSRIMEIYLHFFVSLRGMVLNLSSTWKTLPLSKVEKMIPKN
jgi:hypothetical protein